MTQKYLVRYSLPEASLFIDIGTHENSSNATVYSKLQRLSTSYNFYTWQTLDGHIYMAEFDFVGDLFSKETENTLKKDLMFLSRETKIRELKKYNLPFVVALSYAIGGLNDDQS